MQIVPSRKFVINPEKRLRRLSIVLPVFNEKDTIATTLERVLAAATSLEHELIIIDDYSRDGTRELLPGLTETMRSTFGIPVKLVLHQENQGKGAALRTGFTCNPRHNSDS